VKSAAFRFKTSLATTIALIVSFISGSAFAEHGESNRFDQSETFRLIKAHRYKDAEKAFRRNISSTWRDPDASFYYGETLLRLGKNSDAINVWKRTIQQYPRTKRALDARSAISAAIDQLVLKSGPDNGILGFKFEAKNRKFPEVVRVFLDTPAEGAHIQKGDFISFIDGVPTSNLTMGELDDLLLGPPKTRVEMTIERGNTTFKVDLIRMEPRAFFFNHPDIGKLYLAPASNGTEP
jgi:tetratricopeptide (TPR) repeat protein